jgi:alpha-ribazole phosphatase
MQIYIVRHTTIDLPKGICYGQSDVSLLSTFEAEARTVRDKLPVETDSIYTSPLTRCRRLAESFGYPNSIQEDVRLKEMNFGTWEMKAWDDIEQPALSHWMKNYETVRCPDGESYQDVVDRARSFLDELLSRDVSTAIVVTHGGVIKSMHHLLNKISLAEAMNIRIAYGQVFSFTR